MAVSTFDPGFRDSWRRAALVSLAALVLAGIVVALVSGSSRSGDDEAASTSAGPRSLAFDGTGSKAATTVAAQESAPTAAADEDSSGGAVSRAPLAAIGPRIVMTGALQVRVRGDVSEAIERARGIAAAAGGFVASSSSSTFEEGQGSGEITLRVPADRFDDVRKRLEKLGSVRSSESSGQDVGGQLVDLAARLRTLRAEEAALDGILGATRDIGQILQVRDRLTGVRTEIEQLTGQQAALDDQVTYATIRLSLHEAEAPKAETGDDETTFASSFGTAVDAFTAVLGGMVIVVGAVLPFAVLTALGWGVWLLVRRRRATAPA